MKKLLILIKLWQNMAYGVIGLIIIKYSSTCALWCYSISWIHDAC